MREVPSDLGEYRLRNGQSASARVPTPLVPTVSTEGRCHRSVIARADLLLHRTARHPRGERLAREHVIEPPPDVALAHVAPRRPPGEQPIIVRIDRAADVDQAARQHALDDRALLRQLADCPWLALFRVDVALGARPD